METECGGVKLMGGALTAYAAYLVKELPGTFTYLMVAVGVFMLVGEWKKKRKRERREG